MQIQPIPEQSYNQAILTIAATRQEVLIYREQVPQLQQENAMLKDVNEKLKEQIRRLEAGAG